MHFWNIHLPKGAANTNLPWNGAIFCHLVMQDRRILACESD
jgi:hypothetical protein